MVGLTLFLCCINLGLGGLWVLSLFVWLCLKLVVNSPFAGADLWLSQFKIPSKVSGKCFSNVRMNLSHLKCKRSIHMLYLELIYLASQFASHINASSAFLVWVGSIELSFWRVLPNAVLIRLWYSAWVSLFFCHMLDVVGHWVLKVVITCGLLCWN